MRALPQRASEARCPQPRGVRPEWHAVIDALLCEEPGLWEGEVRGGVKVKTLVEGHRAAHRDCWALRWEPEARACCDVGVLEEGLGSTRGSGLSCWVDREKQGGQAEPMVFPRLFSAQDDSRVCRDQWVLVSERVLGFVTFLMSLLHSRCLCTSPASLTFAR